MDRSSSQPAPAQSQTPAHRDMMFCHACSDEWYRDEHGFECPQCGSDFTEIIEEDNDPRDNEIFADDYSDEESMPDLADAPPHNAHPFHNPWQSDDPEEGDISNVQFTQTAPGRFNVQATVTRSVSPQQFRAAGGMGPASIAGFMTMLNGLAGAAVRGQAQQQQQGQGQGQGQGEGLFSGPNQDNNQQHNHDQNQESSAFQEAQGQNTSPGPQLRATRFQYHGGARLYPRDANNPEPRMEPVDDITNVVTGLLAAFGAPPGSVHTRQHPGGGFETRFGGGGGGGDDGDHEHGAHVHAVHPFFHLFSTLGMGGPTGQMGDFVYSEEGLDRIITQLMEQTASSNAPGPATQTDIDNLPRKKVDDEMLGAEHKAECSICMDDVNLGEEVTVLPCKHWFHHACVSAWLLEHDTCPHCRKGITKRDEGNNSNNNSDAQMASGTQPSGSRTMPGAFDVAGAGTPHDPFVVPGDAGRMNTPSNNNSSEANADTSNEGIANRVRRGWFGPTQ